MTTIMKIFVIKRGWFVYWCNCFAEVDGDDENHTMAEIGVGGGGDDDDDDDVVINACIDYEGETKEKNF